MEPLTQNRPRASWCVTNTDTQTITPLRRCRLNVSLRLSARHTTHNTNATRSTTSTTAPPCPPPTRCTGVISCLGVFQNTPGVFWNTLNHVTGRRASRGRPDHAGCLPRCVRTDGRVEVCAKIVPALVEPRTFVQWVLKEQHSHQTFGQWRRQQSAGQSGLPSTALDHVSATERSTMLTPRPWVSVGTVHGQNGSG